MICKEWIYTALLIWLQFMDYLADAVNFNEKPLYLKWCSSLPIIEHGHVQRFHYKPSIAQVICDDGYQLIGDMKLTCNNSIWSPVKLPYCKIIDNQPHADAGNDVVIHLPKNYVILNGNGSYDDNDDMITYHWWNKDPQLTLDLRGRRTQYLEVYNLQEGTYTFILKVINSVGQQSTDSVTVTVKQRVTTTVKPGSTEECLEYPDIPHSTVRWETSFRAALVECEPGKFIHVNGIAFHSISIKCQNGEWMSADGIKNLPECVRDTDADCGDPPSILHGTYSLTGRTQVKYKCDAGYYTEEPFAILLCEGTSWIGSTPKCKLEDYKCPAPPSIDNGEIYLEDSYNVGSKITYKCNTNAYQLLGNPVMECLDDFTWSRYQPTCILSSSLINEDWFCPAIPPIPNGKCYCNPKKDINFCEPFYLTMKIQCSCNEGYRLVGQRTLTCTDKGLWNYDQPTCVKVDDISIDTAGHNSESNGSTTRMNTLAVVIATACSVLGILLLVMVVMIIRRRKPRPRHYHQVGVPPPYTRVHSSSFDELDRVALIGYDAARLPTYEEAVRNNSSSSVPQRGQGLSEVSVNGEFRPLPSIPHVVRGSNAQNSDIQSVHSNRHSITTMSTVNRDGISEVFGSIDTVNYSMSDASTSVTVDTFDSSASRPSHGSGTATAGSVNTSQENIVTEEAPLLVPEIEESEDKGEDMDIKDEDKN
ncbi:complement factor H-like [Mytilus edulis]|uniref:complement factor H-like n=1 Tax=Mytilus edulis TaxID=6550 RepID=UPI0039EF02CA